MTVTAKPKLLFLCQNIDPEALDNVVTRYGITHIVTSDQDIRYRYDGQPYVRHIDDVLGCTLEEETIEQQVNTIYATIETSVAQKLTVLSMHYRGLRLLDIVRMRLRSSLFHICRHRHVVKWGFDLVDGGEVYCCLRDRGWAFADMIEELAAEQQIELIDLKPELPGPWPGTPTIKQGLVARLGLAKSKVKSLLQAQVRPSLERRPAELRQALKNSYAIHPVILALENDPEYIRTALPVIQEVAPSQPIVVLQQEHNKTPELEEMAATRQVFPIVTSDFITPMAARHLRLGILKFLGIYGLFGAKRAALNLLPTDTANRNAVANGLALALRPNVLDHLVVAEAMYQMLAVTSPSLVVGISDMHPEANVLIQFARRRGIQSLYVNESVFTKVSRAGFRTAENATAMDEIATAAIINRTHPSFPTDNIHVTGLLPRLEAELAKPPTKTRADVCEQIGLTQGHPFIVFAAQEPFPLEYTRALVRATISAMEQVPDAELVIKTHPRSPEQVISQFQRWVDNTNITAHIVTNQISLDQICPHAEAVIAAMSTVTFEAALRDRVGIILNLSDEPDPLPDVDRGFALGAKSSDELAAVLRDVVTNGPRRQALSESRQNFFRANPHLRDMAATKRVASLIDNLANETKRDRVVTWSIGRQK